MGLSLPTVAEIGLAAIVLVIGGVAALVRFVARRGRVRRRGASQVSS